MFAGAGISAVGSLIGSGKQASAIKSAATTQANAAKYAADLQSQATANSLAFTKDVYGKAAGYEAPYQAAGSKAIGELGTGTAPGGEFNSTPTGDQVLAQDPGYQFRLDQGQLALERAEAAGGGVGSGGALKSAAQYGQDYASGEYANAYNRFMTTRQANYSNLANIANYGQQANATVTNAGTGAASNVSGTSLAGAGAQGNYLTQGANATAAGGIGAANAWGNSLSQIGTAAQQGLAAYQLNQSGYGGGSQFNGGAPPNWAAYNAGSTPAGYQDAYGNPIQ
jgi:hypothetical protein